MEYARAEDGVETVVLDEGVGREEMGIGKEWAKRRVRVIDLRRR